MFFMLKLGSTKKSCVAQKIVMSTTTKIFDIEVNVAQQNYVRHKKYVVVTKQIICTQKKTHDD